MERTSKDCRKDSTLEKLRELVAQNLTPEEFYAAASLIALPALSEIKRSELNYPCLAWSLISNDTVAVLGPAENVRMSLSEFAVVMLDEGLASQPKSMLVPVEGTVQVVTTEPDQEEPTLPEEPEDV